MTLKVGVVFLSVLAVVSFLASCGGSSLRCGQVLQASVDPPTASIDHTAAPPANSQQFTATFNVYEGPGCVLPAIPTTVQWTSSDAVNVSLQPQQGAPEAIATCINSTPVPATITATQTNPHATATATLTCR